jgi:uncharacterized protein YkwD
MVKMHHPRQSSKSYAGLVLSLLVLAPTCCAQQPFTPQETGIYQAINSFRRDPVAYIRNLEWERTLYRGNLLSPPGHTPIQTEEGVRAVDEAIAVLRRINGPIGIPLELSRGLSQAAAAHVGDTGGRGTVGHTSSDGDNFGSRISRFGTWSGSIGEAIAYGDADPTGIISQMLIDDGVRDRGHRNTLLDPHWRYVGVSCGAHAVYRGMCVMDFAAGFEERAAPQ